MCNHATIDALGVVTRTTFNDLGRATATTRNYVSGAATTALTNVTTLTTYDVFGRAIATTDALGHTSTTGYNGLGQTVVMTDTVGRVTRMGYDGSGTLRWTKRNDGQITLYQLDSLGRTVATITNYQDGTVGGSEPADQDLISRTSYDIAGRRTQTTDPAGRMTAFAYDNLDRLIAVTENAVTGTCTQAPCNVITQYQYDRAGNRTAIIDANGHTRHFTYDAANQSATTTDALGQITAWDYDAGGRVTTQHDPRGSSYDLTLPLQRAQSDHPNTFAQLAHADWCAVRCAGAAHTARGRDRHDQLPLRCAWADHASASTEHRHHRLRLRRTRPTHGSDVSRFQYTLDRLGQRTNATETLSTTRTISYTYDGLQRLAGATESPGTNYAYAYDDAGNRTGVWVNGTRTVTQTFNAANQVNGLSYDAAGNLTNDSTTTSGYDALGRMTTRGSTTYAYNGDGALVDDGTTRYTQDLAAPLTQVLQTTQGSATTNYLYGLARLAAVAGSTRTWYGTDALGSVRQTLNDTGTPQGVINYDPWGTVESGSVPRFGFTGEVQDAATGLVNLRARWYSTAQGRFGSRDPFAGNSETPYSQQPYAYVLSTLALHDIAEL